MNAKAGAAERITEARNATSVAVLRRLSRHQVREVRRAVAKNPLCPADVLERFADDHTAFVVRDAGVAKATPRAARRKIMDDSRGYVAVEAIKSRYAHPDDVVNFVLSKSDLSVDLAEAAARNRGLTGHAARVMFQHVVATCRHHQSWTSWQHAVAANPATPTAAKVALAQFATSSDVIDALARGKPGRDVVLCELAQSKVSPYAREVAREHADTPEGFRVIATLGG